MTVIKFDPKRRKKKQPVKQKISYRILERYRVKLALVFLLCAAFFQALIYYPRLLMKLPLVFIVLTILAALLEGIDYFKMTFNAKKVDLKP